MKLSRPQFTILRANEQAVELARRRLKRSQSSKTELENDIKDRTAKALKSEVITAKADELAEKATYEQLKTIVASQWW
jgi:hypothetical protein